MYVETLDTGDQPRHAFRMSAAPVRSLSEAVAGSVRGVLAHKVTEVWTLSPDATVYEAISLMATKSIGAILVTAGGVLVGILSERDYSRKVVLTGRSSRETLVREIMTSPVTTVSLDESVANCMRLMTDQRIRHLPVLDRGRLIGVVSIGDLIKAVISQQAEEIRHLNAYIAGVYPA